MNPVGGISTLPLDDRRALEMLLNFAASTADVRHTATALMERFGTLDAVLSAAPEELSELAGIGDSSVALLNLVDWISRRRNGTGATLAGDHAVVGETQRNVAHEVQVPLFPGGRTAQLELTLATPPEPTAEKGAGVKAIQDVLLAEGSVAVKLSTDCQSLEQLQDVLLGKLGQNSIETRRRYAQSICRWFFSDGIDGILRRVWVAYEDEAIEMDLLRWSYLKQESVMGASVADALFPLENGITIPATYLDKFLADHLGDFPPEKTRERLKTNLKKLGFLERARGKGDRLTPVTPQKTSFLILLHYLFAPKSVRTVELHYLFENPFWKFLGYKSEDAVRNLLREADAVGAIGKYIVADQLELVTTCFSLDELLQNKVRL